MAVNGVVGKHLVQILQDAGGTAEEKTVDPGKPCGQFPDAKKEKEQKESAKGNCVVMPVVGAQEFFLAGGDRPVRLREWVRHLSIPPIVD